MRAVPVNDFDFCTQWNFFAEDLEHWTLFNDSPAKCVFRLESDYEDRIPWIRRTGYQVMQDATGFYHSRRCNYDHRAFRRVDRFRFLHVPREVEQRKLEQLAHPLYHLL